MPVTPDPRLVLLHEAISGQPFAIPIGSIVEVMPPTPELCAVIQGHGGTLGAILVTVSPNPALAVAETQVWESPGAVAMQVNLVANNKPQGHLSNFCLKAKT